MNDIQNALTIDFTQVFISVIVILIGVKSVVSLFEWVIDKLGLETKQMRSKREEHDLLMQTSKSLISLQEKHNEDFNISNMRDEEIYQDVQKLTNMFIDKEIDDWRWKILDFSCSLSNGRKYNRESYDHIITIYKKYEKVLKQNDMENGLVDESMKYVYKKYQDFLCKGGTETAGEFYPEASDKR